MNELRNDKNLQEAVSRREQKLPPMPADLNERLMQRLGEQPPSATKQKRLWLYAAVAVAASIALFIVFNFGKEQSLQKPLVAQAIEQTTTQSTPATSVPERVEREPIEGSEFIEEKPMPAKKQRKEVMKLVELIPTSEEASNNVKPLPASVIDEIKVYDKPSDPSITTGIDNTDPLVVMAAQVENIRQRGQRLQQEIDLLMER